MHQLVAVGGMVLIPFTLWEMFESVILPRTITRRARFTVVIYRVLWSLVRASRNISKSLHNTALAGFGPLSLLFLIAVWAGLLVVGFGSIAWGLQVPIHAPHSADDFFTYLYFSGVTLFTLGFGDITPTTTPGRMLTILEAGVGLGFLAAVIGYLPTIYQSFSRREIGISLLDARAGSPPTGAELIRRFATGGAIEQLSGALADLERWAADLLESHLSYPVLAYYRSQHDRESWLASLAATLDACALIRGGFAGAPAWEPGLQWQAQMTFAMCRHALIDLSLVLRASPKEPKDDRLPIDELEWIRSALRDAGCSLEESDQADAAVNSVRAAYEPYVEALAQRLMLEVPPFAVHSPIPDNWQTSAWSHSDHF